MLYRYLIDYSRAGKSSSRQQIQKLFPDEPVTGNDLETQQNALLLQQENQLAAMRGGGAGGGGFQSQMPDMGPAALGLGRPVTGAAAGQLLESESAFISKTSKFTCTCTHSVELKHSFIFSCQFPALPENNLFEETARYRYASARRRTQTPRRSPFEQRVSCASPLLYATQIHVQYSLRMVNSL